MGAISFLRFMRTVFKMRRFIAAAVLLEFALKRSMNSKSKKKSKKSMSQDDLKAIAEDTMHRAQIYIQNLKKQYAKR
jgi:hypothetical protein